MGAERGDRNGVVVVVLPIARRERQALGFILRARSERMIIFFTHGIKGPVGPADFSFEHEAQRMNRLKTDTDYPRMYVIRLFGLRTSDRTGRLLIIFDGADQPGRVMVTAVKTQPIRSAVLGVGAIG